MNQVSRESKLLSHCLLYEYIGYVSPWSNYIFLNQFAATVVACFILLRQSRFLPKKNKNLSSDGSFRKSDLSLEQTGERLRCARRQVESQFCLCQQAHVKVKADSSLNPLWTSLTACVIWNALCYTHQPPIHSFCHASESGQWMMETLFFSGMWESDSGICRLHVAYSMSWFPIWTLPVQFWTARNYTYVDTEMIALVAGFMCLFCSCYNFRYVQ